MAWLLMLVWGAFPVRAAEPESCLEPVPGILTLESAVGWALQYNPELAVFRQQRGSATAAVVIAETYPFNPILESKIRATTGPRDAGITNPVSNEHKLMLELEIRHQGRYRSEGAGAGLSRVDWEIAFQEVSMIVRVIRAFDTAIYRQEKLRLAEDVVRLNEEAADQIATLVKQARLRPPDLLVVRGEVADFRAQVAPARNALTIALNDLRVLLGVVDCHLELQGTLETPLPPLSCAELCELALDRRADLRARSSAVAEAEARLQLALADRYGNPIIGPDYEIDAANVSNIGIQVNLPFPVFNKRKGEILQREAERNRASLELRQTEILVRQQVQAALDRLASAETWARAYRDETLPTFTTLLEQMERLFAQNDPGTDVLRLIDIRRKLLKARDSYLDALWEVSQARADLAAALGDPRFVVFPCSSPPGEAKGASPEPISHP
jgi:cobalt-zinc-cadmium efflux system outer membrane protein